MSRTWFRHVEKAFLGGSGALAALGSWSVLIVILITALMLGAVFWLLFAVALGGIATVVVRAGSRTRWSAWLVGVAAASAVASGGFI